MDEFIALDEARERVRLANRPVTVREYRDYLHVEAREEPAPLARAQHGNDPVTYVSQVDAQAYCHWLGQREGRAYRLPTVDELLALAGKVGLDDGTADTWAQTEDEPPQVHNAQAGDYMCEWTSETTENHVPSGQTQVLGTVFYPPWLHTENSGRVQAMMQAHQGYSFVSFRVATDA